MDLLIANKVMPYETVQLGQCRNLIGPEFFKTMAEDAFNPGSSSKRSIDEEYRSEVLSRYVSAPYSNSVFPI